MERYVYTAAAILLLWIGVPRVGTMNCSAAAAVVMEAKTGRVLYEKQAHQRRPIASITKLMTALVVLKSEHDLDEKVTIQPEWTGIEGVLPLSGPGREDTPGDPMPFARDRQSAALLSCHGRGRRLSALRRGSGWAAPPKR